MSYIEHSRNDLISYFCSNDVVKKNRKIEVQTIQNRPDSSGMNAEAKAS